MLCINDYFLDLFKCYFELSKDEKLAQNEYMQKQRVVLLNTERF